jgi:DNA replication initiation complex subunit (GINS family)
MNLSDLLKIWRVEKGTSELAKLPNNFYSDSHAFLDSIKTDPHESKKAQELYNEVVGMRQHKMLMGCLRHLRGGEKIGGMLKEESEVYEGIYTELKNMRLGVKKEVKVEEVETEEEVEETGSQKTLKTEEESGGIAEEKTEEEPEESKEAPVERGKKDVFKQKDENKGVRKRVKFLKPMPAFVGPNLETIGPFEEDQEVELAEGIAEILMKNDAVEEA